ncbi:MAG: hypothetical protein ACI9CB_000109 [Rhodothermales bacterium]|jgi:hypothetical protein
MNNNVTESSNWTAQNRKNTVRLAYWTAAWTASMALATFGPIFLWNFDSTLSMMGFLLNLGLGFGMIHANKIHLKGLDEMQQKIQLEGMALSLGVGLVCGLSYSLLDTTNLISFDAEISHLVILMGLTYLTGVLLGQRRYR